MNDQEKVEFVSNISGCTWEYAQNALAHANGDPKRAINTIVNARFHAKTKENKLEKIKIIQKENTFTLKQLQDELNRRKRLAKAHSKTKTDMLKEELEKRVKKLSFHDHQFGHGLFSNKHVMEVYFKFKNPILKKATLELLEEE